MNINEILTDNELNILKEQNSKSNYGFSKSGLLKFIAEYKKAKQENDLKTMAKIEYRLDDCNFRSFSSKLSAGDYKTARQEAISIFS